MNPDAILSLISDLYRQAAALQAENAQLRQALAESQPTDPDEGWTPTPERHGLDYMCTDGTCEWCVPPSQRSTQPPG